MTLEEIRKQLDSNIPESEVDQREAWKGGPKLSYLTGAYVIKRMNDVLGQGNWGYRISELTKVFEGEISQRNGDAFTTSYISRIELWFKLPGQEMATYFEDVGYGDGTDAKSKGKAHELAVKEAVTDGIKRAAKNLGISMGLGLYFKSGEYVEESTPARTENIQRIPSGNGESAAKPVKADVSKATKAQVKSAFAVLEAQKKITKEVFVKEYLNGSKTDDLTDAQLKAVVEKLRTNFKELGL